MMTDTHSSAPTTRIEIGSDALAADPWPALKSLRESGPVVWHEDYGRWFVTSDRAIRKVLSNFSRFTVEDTVMADLFGTEAFISMDDRRRHDELRNIWVDAFRKQGLDGLRPTIDRIVAGLVDDAAARLSSGEIVDVAHSVCRPLPTLVICSMMGVPEEAIDDVVRWSDAMASGSGTYVGEEEAARRLEARNAAKESLAAFLLDLLAQKRARPADDLVSLLAVSEPGQRLPDEHLVQNLRQLLFAGNETTAKWLGHIFVTYAQKPNVRDELRQHRALITAANDEVMRWQTVVGTNARNVRGGAIELMGVDLSDGDQITCLLGSANRDPARYDEPDRFDIHRPAQPNLGFGVGFHNCLGSVLAKIEAEATMEAVLDKLPDFTLVEEPRYSAISLRGPYTVALAAA